VLDSWLIWLIVAGALAVGEVLTLGFLLGPLALAAAVTAAAAGAGASTEIQLVIFILGSLASLLVFRPIAQRHMRTPAQLRTGTAALVGRPALVLEAVDRDGGRVKIGGEEWTARSYDEDRSFTEGARVEVMRIDGATALVSD